MSSSRPPSAPRVLISAGELSGEQHAARLIAALKKRSPAIEIDAYGGDLMVEAGANLIFPLSRFAVLGFAAVFKALPVFAGILRGFAEHLVARRPDAVVLVDYPGLHLKFAEMARRAGIPVFYFCCPQLWAWAPWRSRRFARRVDRAYTIFPFEERYYRALGVAAEYVGHPAADRLASESLDAEDQAWMDRLSTVERPIAILPGSRPQEVRANLPWMLEIARRIAEAEPNVQFFLPQLRADTRRMCEAILTARGKVSVTVMPRVAPLLRKAHFTLVASGTATFEVGYFGVPMIVLYKITRFQRWLGSYLLTTPYIAQVNLIAGRQVVPEFVEVDEPIEKVVVAALELIRDGAPRQAQRLALREELAHAFAPGAAERTAERILVALESTPARSSGD